MPNRISSIQDTSVAGRQTRFAAVWWWRLARLLSLLWRVRLLRLEAAVADRSVAA